MGENDPDAGSRTVFFGLSHAHTHFARVLGEVGEKLGNDPRLHITVSSNRSSIIAWPQIRESRTFDGHITDGHAVNWPSLLLLLVPSKSIPIECVYCQAFVG